MDNSESGFYISERTTLFQSIGCKGIPYIYAAMNILTCLCNRTRENIDSFLHL